MWTRSANRWDKWDTRVCLNRHLEQNCTTMKCPAPRKAALTILKILGCLFIIECICRLMRCVCRRASVTDADLETDSDPDPEAEPQPEPDAESSPSMNVDNRQRKTGIIRNISNFGSIGTIVILDPSKVSLSSRPSHDQPDEAADETGSESQSLATSGQATNKSGPLAARQRQPELLKASSSSKPAVTIAQRPVYRICSGSHFSASENPDRVFDYPPAKSPPSASKAGSTGSDLSSIFSQAGADKSMGSAFSLGTGSGSGSEQSTRRQVVPSSSAIGSRPFSLSGSTAVISLPESIVTALAQLKDRN